MISSGNDGFACKKGPVAAPFSCFLSYFSRLGLIVFGILQFKKEVVQVRVVVGIFPQGEEALVDVFEHDSQTAPSEQVVVHRSLHGVRRLRRWGWATFTREVVWDWGTREVCLLWG